MVGGMPGGIGAGGGADSAGGVKGVSECVAPAGFVRVAFPLTVVPFGRVVAARSGGQRDQVTDLWKLLEVKSERRSINRKQAVTIMEENLQRSV